ncbi:hypothetical protein NL676_034643 [Syzygium grande]|nr:hypothetical protein NL676_034643 [Syzygium grande]
MWGPADVRSHKASWPPILAILRVVLPPDRQFSPQVPELGPQQRHPPAPVPLLKYRERPQHQHSSSTPSSSSPQLLRLGTSTQPSSSLSHAISSSATTFGLSSSNCINDVFDGVAVQITEHVVTQRQSCPLPNAVRSFRLRILRLHLRTSTSTPTWTIIDKANDIRHKNQERLLYTISAGVAQFRGATQWESVPFKHPTTFDTLAMNPEKKGTIMEDLRNFVGREGLLPEDGPGLEAVLPALRYPKPPHSKSYYSPDAPDTMCGGEDGNNNTITFSRLLNFPDGLWSCCGGERIFVFTTNHIEKLDPALLQSSQMDMHICMS